LYSERTAAYRGCIPETGIKHPVTCVILQDFPEILQKEDSAKRELQPSSFRVNRQFNGQLSSLMYHLKLISLNPIRC
jgi:hypothetical protein